MRKPTTEEWEIAWDKMRTYCQSLWSNAKEGIDPFDPRMPFHQNSNEPEGMSLAEIVAEAEPGEEFTCGDHGARFGIDSEGKIFIAHKGGWSEMKLEYLCRRAAILSREWCFTKRHNRCPECGHILEDK